MFYSELVKKACLIMFEAHKNDTDKGGYPYVFHPFYLASQMEDEDTVCAALLHDVIEDHSDAYSFERFAAEGFSEKTLNALRLLTYDASVPYLNYVRAIGKDPVARRVKLADLMHNLDSRRVNGAKPKKYALYMEALKLLEEQG